MACCVLTAVIVAVVVAVVVAVAVAVEIDAKVETVSFRLTCAWDIFAIVMSMTEKEPQIVKITEVKNISNRGWKIQLKNLCGSDKGLIMCTLFIFAVLLVLSKSGVDFQLLKPC